MRLITLLPLLTICHGAALPESEKVDLESIMDTFQDFLVNPSPYLTAFGARPKRHTHPEGHDGFQTYSIPMVGEVGVKYIDPSNHVKGGEAFIHINDLKSLIPAAHSNLVKLHLNFDGGANQADGLFTAVVDYHLVHSDGDGEEEGSLNIVREQRNGNWHTSIRTEAHPFSGVPIIPARISNLNFELESDRVTMLSLKYFNAPASRDIKVDITRIPGKSITAVITKDGAVSTIKGVLSSVTGGYGIAITANILGSAYTGDIVVKLAEKDVAVTVMKGTEPVLNAKFQVKAKGPNAWKYRSKISVMGGSMFEGELNGEVGASKFMLVTKPSNYKLTIIPVLGRSIHITMEKGTELLWEYQTLREDKSTASHMIYEASSEMTLSPNSKLHQFIAANYPFGAFLSRANHFKITVDKNERNFLLKKFKIEFNIVKDNAQVFNLLADTTVSPYNFELSAPNLGIAPPVTATIDHVRGSHLIFNSNIDGGISLNAQQSPNAKGGREISIVTTKGGVEMLTYTASTEKVNTPAVFSVGLKGHLTIKPESLLYRTIVGRYQILTPFATRDSDLSFVWDKVARNTLMNQFEAKAKIDKDGAEVLNIDISTKAHPYKFHVFCPALLGKLRTGMEVVDVTVDHVLGQHLHFNVNHPGAQWRGFKIDKVGNTNQRTIEWNGVQLGSGDYTMTDNSFTTSQTLSDGRALTTTITSQENWDSANFILNNVVHVELDGTERQLNLNMDWNMVKLPDMDLNTPESGHFNMNAVGHNARWGDYSIARAFNWGVANRRLTVDLTGEASFGLGALAPKSPIVTEIVFTYDSPTKDLEGVFKKVMAGREYSITFPHGSFVMPTIRLGA